MKWELAGIITEGERLKICGLNVWDFTWAKSELKRFDAPHPNYPSQRHEMSPFSISHNGKQLHFAASEVSANVYLFYVPRENT